MRTKTNFSMMAIAIIVLATFGLFSMLLMTGGCAGKFVTTSAASVGVAAATYDIGMRTVADLQASGMISTEQRLKINEVAYVVYQAIIVADQMLIAYNSALNVYEETKSAEDKATMAAAKAALKVALDHMDTTWADYAKLVNSIVPDTLPEKL